MIWGIRDRRTFGELRSSGVPAGSGPLTVVVVADGSASPPRVAFAIGRRVGTAVVRNRLRRRLQARLRAAAASGRLPSGAYLVVVRPEAAQLGPADLGTHLDTAIRRVLNKVGAA